MSYVSPANALGFFSSGRGRALIPVTRAPSDPHPPKPPARGGRAPIHRVPLKRFPIFEIHTNLSTTPHTRYLSAFTVNLSCNLQLPFPVDPPSGGLFSALLDSAVFPRTPPRQGDPKRNLRPVYFSATVGAVGGNGLAPWGYFVQLRP